MAITVKQLVSDLRQLPQNAVVVLSSDAEGNRFHHLMGIDPSASYKEGGYRGVEIGITELTDEARGWGLTDADLMVDGSPAVVLYPAD